MKTKVKRILRNIFFLLLIIFSIFLPFFLFSNSESAIIDEKDYVINKIDQDSSKMPFDIIQRAIPVEMEFYAEKPYVHLMDPINFLVIVYNSSNFMINKGEVTIYAQEDPMIQETGPVINGRAEITWVAMIMSPGYYTMKADFHDSTGEFEDCSKTGNSCTWQTET